MFSERGLYAYIIPKNTAVTVYYGIVVKNNVKN
jgi:hypothetical protein